MRQGFGKRKLNRGRINAGGTVVLRNWPHSAEGQKADERRNGGRGLRKCAHLEEILTSQGGNNVKKKKGKN